MQLNLKGLVAVEIAAAVLVSCGDSGTGIVIRPAPQSVSGCYYVRLGKWSGPRESPNPPPAVELLDSLGTTFLEKGNSLVRSDPVSAPMPYDMAWWHRLDSNHLDVFFSAGGYSGVSLHLVWGWGDGSWGGTAEAYTDVGPSPQAIATANLAPKTCS